ncbi:uncharacterized protein ARMOST_15526 [Armillaria ostoyae]|uniref:Uncharacterized protein n=1 Tax=Armillaria ostoyae TaxID=47428 RepID=A0A284RTQ7_ARMOS|nr:uncharacterized protein ARMOST_15526 [Armillaria ostoyae]
MARPRKYTMEETKQQANRDKSTQSYAKCQDVIWACHKEVYEENKKCRGSSRIRGSNVRELIERRPGSSRVDSVSHQSPKVIPQNDAFIALGIHSRRILHDFEAYTNTDDIITYVKSLMRQYFSHNKHNIGTFTVPLDQLYEFRRMYEDVLAEALQAEGCTTRRDAMEKAGKPIMDVIAYVEDIWCTAIEGPGPLRLAYTHKRLAWQH